MRSGLMVPDISNTALAKIVDEIDGKGYGVVENYFQRDDRVQIRVYLKAAVDAAGGQYVGFLGKYSVAGTLLDKLSDRGPFLQTSRATPIKSRRWLYSILRAPMSTAFCEGMRVGRGPIRRNA